MRIIDTHTHIYQDEFKEDIRTVIKHAFEEGVDTLLLPNVDRDSLIPMLELCREFPGICYPMMGLHPTSVKENYKGELEFIHSQLLNGKYIGIGEIGLDLYWDKTYLQEQIIAFETQLQWSIEQNLPVVIHNREAFEYVVNSLEKTGADKLKGVFHSFGGTQEELQRILQMDHFYIGINGIVTFKNSSLSRILEEAPLERIILETDAPYLTPVPYRGKRNEPSYLKYIVDKLSSIYQISKDEIAAITTANALSLFSGIRH